MKIDQRQFRRKSVDETATDVIEQTGTVRSRKRGEEIAEEELQKLFLARLDVHSRIADLKRNRVSLRSRKVDVERKITFLCDFDAKLMQREEELSRSITES